MTAAPERRALTYRCHTCGAVLTSWAAAERHADAHGGARLEIIQPEGDTT